MPDGIDYFGYLGVIPAMAMFCLPGVLLWRIWNNPDTSPHPNTMDAFCGMWVFCILWIVYGILDVNAVIIIPNLIGIIVATIAFFGLWLRAGPHRGRQQTAIVVAIALSAILVLIGTAFVPLDEQRPVSGWVCFVGGFLFFTAPLPLIRFVLATKDATPLALGSIVATLVSCLWQVLYGAMRPELSLALANAIGALVSLAGLFAYVKYRNGPPADISAGAGGAQQL